MTQFVWFILSFRHSRGKMNVKSLVQFAVLSKIKTLLTQAERFWPMVTSVVPLSMPVHLRPDELKLELKFKVM